MYQSQIYIWNHEPKSGTYTLTLNSETTSPIAALANEEAIQDALEALPGVGLGGVTSVTRTDGSVEILFAADPGSLLSVDSSELRYPTNPELKCFLTMDEDTADHSGWGVGTSGTPIAYEAGKIGSAITCQADTNIYSDLIGVGTTGHRLFAWVKVDPTVSGGCNVLSTWQSGNPGGISIDFMFDAEETADHRFRCTFSQSGGYVQITDGSTISLGVWYFLIVAFNGSSVSFTVNSSTSSSPASLTIGSLSRLQAGGADLNGYFRGAIDAIGLVVGSDTAPEESVYNSYVGAQPTFAGSVTATVSIPSRVLTPGVAAAAATAVAADVVVAADRTLTPGTATATVEVTSPTVQVKPPEEPDVGIADAEGSDVATLSFSARGREPIAMDQPPQGGSWYPFESDDYLRSYVADAYLAYFDRQCNYRLPFRIAWLYGFGQNFREPIAGWPTPTHAIDVVIKDADDQTVFDSTLATTFQRKAWNGRLAIVEWRAPVGVLRLVQHTTWSPDQVPVEFPLYYSSLDSGQLVSRVTNRLPDRVTGLLADSGVANSHVDLVAGYNTRIDVEPLADVVGGRLGHRLTFQAIPGEGDGREPGCVDLPQDIYTINRVQPDASGRFHVEADTCLRVARPFVIAGSPPVGTLPTNASRHAIRVFDDCQPCYDCDEIIRVYEAIRKLWAYYVTIGAEAQAASGTYQSVVTRWNNSQSCRLGARLKLLLVPICPCLLVVSAGFCNNSDACLTDLSITMNLNNAGPGTKYRCQQTFRLNDAADRSNQAEVVEPYVLTEVEGGGFRATWSQVNPRTMAHLQTVFEVPGCAASPIDVTITSNQGGTLTESADMIPPDESGECC